MPVSVCTYQKEWDYDLGYNPEIIIITVNGKLTRDEWTQYLSYFENVYDYHCPPRYQNPHFRQKMYLLWDLSNTEMIPFSWLHEQAKLLEKIKPKTVKHLIATSVIITNNILRQGLNMLLKLYRNHRPVRITRNLEDSISFFSDLGIPQQEESSGPHGVELKAEELDSVEQLFKDT